MGHVGIILGLEMSWLVRSSADWYRLFEMCALCGSLLADQGGVYNPADVTHCSHFKECGSSLSHHPLCGEHGEVIRRYRAGAVMIVVSDGTNCLIPHWMLDAAVCSAVSDEVRPRISLERIVVTQTCLTLRHCHFS